MSIKFMAKVYELAVDTDTREILLALADHADDEGYSVFPSVARIAWKIGDGKLNKDGEYKNIRTVQRRIKYLQNIGALVELKRPGFHRPTEYGLDLSVFPKKSEFRPKGDNLSLKGDKIALKGDTMLSPDPSLNVNETKDKASPPPENISHEKTAQELWDEMDSAKDAPITDNGLIPVLPEEKHLFDALNVERDARHYTRLVRFKTTKQREKFRICVQFFNGSTSLQIDELIANGKSDIESVVNALDWRRRNYEKPEPRAAVRENAIPVDMSKVIIR